jgi:cation:H+ antiporter
MCYMISLPLILLILIFIASLAVLIIASNTFTSAAERIGIFFGIPSFIIGVTIVAFGTSLPELISSIFAVLKGSSEIVVGNVIGSNITNIFLILGLTAIIGKRITLSFDIAYVDLPLLVGSALLFGLMVSDREFGLSDAIFSVFGIIIYLFYAANNAKDEIIQKKQKYSSFKSKKLEPKTWLTIFISGLFIYFSAFYTVESIVIIAEKLKIGKELIAASAVALGTSLPELVVSVIAAIKNKPEIAIGNILGSNIFNTFAVMGVPSLLGRLVLPETMVTFGMPTMVIATLLFFFITQQKRITQWEGWLLLVFYLFFLGKLFSLV